MLVTLLARLLVAHLVRVGVGVRVRAECCGMSGAQVAVAVAPIVVGISAWFVSLLAHHPADVRPFFMASAVRWQPALVLAIDLARVGSRVRSCHTAG